jgi:hypothetical protein
MSYEPYPGGGYQPYPGGPDGGLPERRQAPPGVLNAVKLMWTGAGISLISVIIGLVTIGSLKTAIEQANPNLSSSQVSTVATASVAAVVIVGLLGVGLWIWLAQMCKAGKNWARVTGTVLFGIDTLFQLISFTRSAALTGRIPGLIVWLVGLGAVILLWQRPSSDYFKGQAAPW